MILALAASSGCSRCNHHETAPDAGPPPAPAPVLPALLPAPRPWTFARVRGDAGLALPERCRHRAPIVRAPVTTLTRFVAEPRTPGVLVIADAAEGSPPTLTGVAALTLDPEGVTRDPVPLPWFNPAALPRLARAGDRWIGALDHAGSPPMSSVHLWRGSGAELVAEGDGLETVDLACSAPASSDAGTAPAAVKCALLTTRAAKVAAPGAAVWVGSPADPPARWASAEIAAAGADSDARPMSVAAIDASRVVVALQENSQVVLHEVTGAAAHVVGRLPVPFGAIDAIAAPVTAAMAPATPVSEDGCASEGHPGVRFVRPGAPPVDFPLPSPPSHGVIRPLARGAIAVWIAPVGCRVARQVVYALVLDEAGAPVGSPIPIGDANTFGVASRGDDVDLWIQDTTSVTWVRAGCGGR